MSEQQPVQQGEWLATVLRLTAFSDTAESLSGDGWWESIVGKPSEEQTKRISLVVQELGPYASGRLVLTIQPSIIDWRLVPPETEEIPSEGVPTIGGFSQGLDAFMPPMLRWLGDFSPNLRRLAFGAELSLPVTNRVEGYELIAPYLRNSVKIDTQGSQDLIYQINRPRTSKANIPDLRINRLSNWSVKTFATALLSIGQTIDFPTELGVPFSSLQVDINTAAEYKAKLPRDQLQIIFRELVEMGKEIAREGDIP